MKILDLEQQGQEWLDFHEGRISGSSTKTTRQFDIYKETERWIRWK